MLSDSVRYYTQDPLYLFIPGTALFIVVLAFNLLGDSLRDALDPRAGRS
jgi:peptide/nickel transport system permease protein